MALYKVNEEDLVAIADAIREQTGLSKKFVYPNEFIEAIDSIEVKADDENLKKYIEGTLESIYSEDIDEVGEGAFQSCSNLTSVNLPNCFNIGAGAFSGCSNLTTISFPNCFYIESSAFYSCSKLTVAAFPNCSYIEVAAFNRCSRLTTTDFPNCSYIGNNAFYSCLNLTSISFPNCSYIGVAAFQSCKKLQSIYLLAFNVPQLASANAFLYTPLSNSSYLSNIYGSIYVRQSLLASFKTAKNWSYYSSRFVGLTDEEINNLSF